MSHVTRHPSGRRAWQGSSDSCGWDGSLPRGLGPEFGTVTCGGHRGGANVKETVLPGPEQSGQVEKPHVLTPGDSLPV